MTSHPEKAASVSDTAVSENAFHYPAFVLYWSARFLNALAIQIISVAVGWQLYDATRSTLLLGLVGLVQFAPSLILVLVTGSVADRFPRNRIMTACIAFEAMCVAAIMLVWANAAENTNAEAPVVALFVLLSGLGLARAFLGPAVQSLVANIVPKKAFANAVAWNSSSWQVATIAGPVAGGLLYGIAPNAAYGTALVSFVVALIATLFIVPAKQERVEGEGAWERLSAGVRYIRNQPVVLGAISLDMFAVLLGGAFALLPAVARDILDVGPWGLGFLRAAPGVGAVAMAIWLMRFPIRDHAGFLMFVAVVIYGLSVMVFGLSTAVWLSIAALTVMGAADMVSVYVRATLIQLATPDALRGRVSAVNMVFIGASNEVGEFRAGGMASLIGIVPAIVLGGAGSIAIAALWARMFPELRNARRLDGKTETSSNQSSA